MTDHFNNHTHTQPDPNAEYTFNTQAIHAGVEPCPNTGAMLTPIYQTTTYAQSSVGYDKGYTYSRTGNPTVSALEKKLGELEDIHEATCFATGMAAITGLCLALLKSGDHIVCSDVVYGGTVRLIDHVFTRFGISVSYVDTSTPERVENAINEHTRLVFIETPANPTLKLTDIAKIARISHKYHTYLAVDNTFLTAALQKPFKLGADIVIYSTTKYIDGHNATVGGALLAQDADLTEKFKFIQNTIGAIISPFNAWLILQGIKTLPIRIKTHSENACTIAKHLENHPLINRVSYPGLPSFEQYELAKRQQKDHGGIIAFEVKGGYQAGVELLNHTRLCTLAENLGAIETILTHPASMTHGPIEQSQREAIGISEGLVRLSVGLEDPSDIIQDIDQSLSQVKREVS
jgi:cystathionine beta-lyase/cystathionine gamma-synthase